MIGHPWAILTDEAQAALTRAALRGSGGSLSLADARAVLAWAAGILDRRQRWQWSPPDDWQGLAAALAGEADLSVQGDAVRAVAREVAA